MRKKKALIFAKNPLTLDHLEKILLLRGYDVLAFRNPIVCPIYNTRPETCKNLRPCADVLITDSDIPNIDGVNLLLKQYERGCQMDIRNKAVIADHVPLIDKRLIDYVGFKHLKKPFDLTEISKWLDECEQRIDLDKMVGVMRRHDRRLADIRIVYEVQSSEKTYEGIVTNISNGGLCLTTDTPITTKDHILVRTPLPNFCRKAMVRWVKETNAVSFAAGLLCYQYL